MIAHRVPRTVDQYAWAPYIDSIETGLVGAENKRDDRSSLPLLGGGQETAPRGTWRERARGLLVSPLLLCGPLKHLCKGWGLGHHAASASETQGRMEQKTTMTQPRQHEPMTRTDRFLRCQLSL